MSDRRDVAATADEQEAASSVPTGIARLEGSRALRGLARGGFVALGLVHLVLATLTGALAIDPGAGSPNGSGALGTIAASPFGGVTLWAMAGALWALALFASFEGVVRRPREGWWAIVRDGGRALAYAGVGFAAAVTALAGRGGMRGDRVAMAVDATFAHPLGQVAVGVVGAAIAAAGVTFVVLGLRRIFEQHVDPPARARRFAIVLGMAGYLAKGVSFCVLGSLVLAAAITLDADRAGGVEAALGTLRVLPAGPVLLAIVAAGIAAFGLFCLARALWPPKR